MDLQSPAAPTDLVGAVQQPNIPGALQSLLLSRVHSAADSQELTDKRNSALQMYQQQLLQPPADSPVTQGAIGWLDALAKGKRGFDAAAAGIGAGASALDAQNVTSRNNQILAAKAGYDDAVAQDVAEDKELSALRGGLRGVGAVGGIEKILPLYRGIFNSYSQQAKDMQFTTPAERAIWIKANTDETVRATLQNFNIALSPAVLNSLTASTLSTSNNDNATSTDATVNRNGSTVDMQTAKSTDLNTSSPGNVTPNSANGKQLVAINADKIPPGKEKEVAKELSGLSDVLNNGKSTPVQVEAAKRRLAELQAMYGDARVESSPVTLNTDPNAPKKLDNAQLGKFSQLTPPGAVPFKNTANEKLTNAAAEGMGKNYADDYKTMQETAVAAKDQLDAFNNLKKLKVNTGNFTDAAGYIGRALDAMGGDASSPLIQNAIKNREANTILDQMTNAALRGEKGVQTRSDEIRIKNEFAKTLDPQQAWNYLTQLGAERAQRKVDMLDFASGVSKDNNGIPIEARQKFIADYANDPLTQRMEGKLIFRTPTINAYMRKYPDATKEEAVNYWRSLEHNYNTNGGK